MAMNVRRVVTATNADGKSRFLFDGPAQSILEQPGRGLVFHELWETDGPLADTESTEDAGNRPIRHHPPHGGTRFRIVEFMPDEQQQQDIAQEDFATLEASDILLDGAEDPSMHRNETVDYNIILQGEIYSVVDEGEVLLKAGDVLIQRGTAHTWHNRSNRPCIFASIMISAAPHPLFARDGDNGETS
ncbi:MAG: cupin domain-containing protein [Alphaproteobacteria bacterium]|nr:cupin domain-containing protein [Alphaproteobacteria bacterium]